MTAALYQTDPYAWALEQAALLKAGRLAEIDVALIAEEMEDMGNEIRNACFSFLRRILEHLLKLRHSRQAIHQDHWRTEVINFRLELKDRLTRAITNQIDLEQLYRQAVRLAVSALRTAEPDFAKKLPPTCPWTLAQVMDEDFWPE